jgi:hypothetical protein
MIVIANQILDVATTDMFMDAARHCATFLGRH